ncbi:hypothetical protein Scep_014903 [Stephania cephalantha]|uniref:Uncharacterized protein n=1 Tax=Stephania cephalantha TaxID=152367 RepID=A0AAP0J1W6_9MAGN
MHSYFTSPSKREKKDLQWQILLLLGILLVELQKHQPHLLFHEPATSQADLSQFKNRNYSFIHQLQRSPKLQCISHAFPQVANQF